MPSVMDDYHHVCDLPVLAVILSTAGALVCVRTLSTSSFISSDGEALAARQASKRTARHNVLDPRGEAVGVFGAHIWI
jgi:hypothetical protein